MTTQPDYSQEQFDAMSEEEQESARLEYKLADLMDYLDTGEIRSGLSAAAHMVMYDNQKWRWSSIDPKIAAFEQKWARIYALVYADCQAIQFAAKEFEFRHWMGFCEADVKALMKSYKRWTYMDWDSTSKEEGDRMRDLWNPSPDGLDYTTKDETYWGKSWQPYIDRRTRKPLQHTYAESSSFLSSEGNALDQMAAAVTEGPAERFARHLKLSIGSSAGRVLLTIQDKLARDDPENEFDGAHLTLIFDEAAGYPRGGVQGHAATRDEALGMLKTLNDYMPTLAPDPKLRIC